MPIYEYRCASCGFQKETLQKIKDKPLTICPGCGKKTFKKLVSAAGFQLKGSGWYATDFKGKGKGKPKDEPKSKDEGKPAEESKSAACGADAGPACQN